MTWELFVMGMQSDLIGAITGALLSVFVEYWPQYETFDPKAKRLIFAVLCLLVPTVGVALGIASGFQEPIWDVTFWPALQAAFVAFGAGQAAHLRKL